MGPVSATTVGDATMRVLGDGLVERAPVRGRTSTPAADGTDETAGQPGTARKRGIRAADESILDDLSRAGNDRVTLRLRASLVSVAWSPAGSLTVRTFVRGRYYPELQSVIRMELFAHRASADSAHERTRRGLPDNRNGDTHRYRIADAVQNDFPWHGVRSVTNGRGAGCCRRLKFADTEDSSRTD